jgi:glycosyltransferase involved in cell wall biosynthesis
VAGASCLEEDCKGIITGYCCYPWLLGSLCFWPYGSKAKASICHLGTWRSPGYSRLEKLAARTPPDLLIANSQYTLTEARKSYPKSNTEVIYFPYQPSEVQHREDSRAVYRRELSLADDDFVVVMVSRMEAWKGHRILIEAIKLIEHYPHLKALVVGGAQRPEETQYQQSLAMKVRELGLDGKFRFLGQRHDVSPLISCADIFCQPNLSPVPFGLVFIEALHAGLPVITTDFGGGKEIVTPDCGWLCPVDNPRSVAEAIEFYIQNDEVRERCKVAGPKRADELCNPDQQMAKLHSAFQRLVA